MYISIQLTPAQAHSAYATYRKSSIVEKLMRQYDDKSRDECITLATAALEIADIELLHDDVAIDNAIMEASWRPRNRDVNIIEVSNWLIRRGFEFDFIQEGPSYCLHLILGNKEFVVPINNVQKLNQLWDELISYWS